MTENPAGKGSKMGLGTDLSKVSGMSKDARVPQEISSLAWTTTVDSRVCESNFQNISLSLCFWPHPRRRLLANCISLLMLFFLKRSCCVDQRFVFAALAYVFRWLLREREKIALFDNVFELQRSSPFDVQRDRVDREEASAKFYLHSIRRDFVSETLPTQTSRKKLGH